MATRGRPPEGSAGKVTRSFDNVKGEGIRHGWLDGPIHCSECHASRRTKPCMKWLYGPDAKCEGCAGPFRARWMGWLPVRREDGRPWIVVISAARFEVANGIRPGSRVSWGRDQGDAQGVWVLPRDKGATWATYYPELKPNADLTEPMATLWGMPEIIPALRAIWAVECQPTVTDAEEGSAELSYPPDAPPELVARARERGRSVGASSAAAEGIGSVLDRVPGKNGNGKPHT